MPATTLLKKDTGLELADLGTDDWQGNANAIELHAEGTRIIKAKNACSLGESWFRNHTADHDYPDALIDGKPASLWVVAPAG